jgi:hypothetical protein
VRHDAAEQRVGRGRHRVGVRVEAVAGEVGEVRDVLLGHEALLAHHRVTDPQAAHRLAEGVLLGLHPRRARRVDAGDRREHVRRALHRGALQEVPHAAHAAELLAAARRARAAVHQVRQRRAVAGRLPRAVPVQDVQPAVVAAAPSTTSRTNSGSWLTTEPTRLPCPSAISSTTSAAESYGSSVATGPNASTSCTAR